MPLTEKQVEYLRNCGHRWNVKTGAVRSGKSFVDYTVTIPGRIINAKGEGLIVLIGNTRGTLERNILAPMRSMYPNSVGVIRSDNTVSLFGKTAYALGADNKKHVARIQGATMEYVYGDEITTWSQEVFEMLKSRLSCEHSHFDGTCNPASPKHWFKSFLDSDADIYQQHYLIDDGALPPQVVQEIKKEYAGTVYYKRYILGEWAMAEGLIYPMYQNALCDTLDGSITDYSLSIDYGTMNAFAAILWAYSGGVWYAVREYYYSGRDKGVQKTDQEYADDLDAFISGVPIVGKVETIIDPSAASFIALLQKRGKYKVRKADNAVTDGIRETATCMANGKIKILSHLKNGIAEIEGYVWDETAGEDRPIKEKDHFCDAMRYFVKTKHIAKVHRTLGGTYADISRFNGGWAG